MSEPTREYGFITAITPEEIKALGDGGEQEHFYEGWAFCGPSRAGCCDLPRRKRIDPDPSMPDGQKRWEIVPAGEMETVAMQFTDDGINWRQNFLDCEPQKVDSFGIIYAFRRPTALKEAGTGSVSDEAKENAQLVEYYVGKHKEWEDELSHLRTLAKAQGEALRLAQKSLKGLMGGVNESRCNGHKGFPIPDCIKRMADAQETLTLIAKLKEVGE